MSPPLSRVVMAKYGWIAFVFLLWVSLFVSETAMVKIHRAVPRMNTKPRADSSWFAFEPCKYLPDLSKLFLNKEAWLYSIPATILVGMCGIFPLLVIPVEAGHALREGGEFELLSLDGKVCRRLSYIHSGDVHRLRLLSWLDYPVAHKRQLCSYLTYLLRFSHKRARVKK